MANDAEMRVRFGRVISAIRALIDSLTARDAAWEELKKGTVGVYADSAIACSKARQAFEDETPTMDALVIALRDNCYKDPTWQTDGEDDVKLLRMVWHAIHKTIEAGKSFAPDDLGVMRNLCAALERARDSSWGQLFAILAEDGIPIEHRSKPIAKNKAAKLLGRTGDEGRAVEWLNKCINDGTISCVAMTRQTFCFDIRQFAKDKHPQLRP